MSTKTKDKPPLSLFSTLLEDNPELRKLLDSLVYKLAVATSLLLSSLLLGLLLLINAIKTVLELGWQADLVIGLTVIFLSAIFIIRTLTK